MTAEWTRAQPIPALALMAVMTWVSGCGPTPAEDPGELRDAVRIEGAPMCPWRQPADDVAVWFPGATRGETEVLILSGLRSELAHRLGRPVTAEENALYLHRIVRDRERLGEVAVRRVKGESGAVELVVAFDSAGKILGVRIQRSREPAAVATALDSAWLGSFRGRQAGDPLRPGTDLPAVPESARVTAAAVAEGVRSVLVQRELAALPGAVRRPAPEAAAGHFH